MPNTINITFADGSAHSYQNVPSDATPDQVEKRALQEFPGKKVKSLERAGTAPAATAKQGAEGGGKEHSFSGHSVEESAAIGGVIGGVLGRSPVAALGGAAVGALSGFAGETARTAGASELAAFGIEVAAGGLVGAVKAIGKTALDIGTRAIASYPIYAAMKKSVAAAEEFAPTSATMSKAEKAVKERILGVKPEVIPVTQTQHQVAAQRALQKELTKSGVVVPQGEKASTVVRAHLTSQMTDLTGQGKAFIQSPEAQTLGKDLQGLVQRKLVKPAELDTISSLLKNQTSKLGTVAPKANVDMLNLIQNGGQYVEDGTVKTLISPEAQSALRVHFNTYLQANGKGAMYDVLKKTEATEFQAKAVDEIPGMLREGFKHTKGDEFAKTLLDVKHSGPEGQKLFRQALTAHFNAVHPERFQYEFNRIAHDIKATKSGVISDGQLDHVQELLRGIPKGISTEKLKQFQQTVVRAAFTAGIAGEAGAGMDAAQRWLME